jgi:hypothetical protein
MVSKLDWRIFSNGTTYHLQTDDTATDDDHLLGNLRESKGTSAGDDALLIDVQAGEGRGLGTGGDDDVLSAEGLLTTLEEVDLDGVGIDKGTGTLDVVDTVLLEEELDTLGKTGDGVILGLHHLLEVELDITDLDTALFRVMEDLMVEVGVVEEGLGGDTADVQASTTETATLLDTSGLWGGGGWLAGNPGWTDAGSHREEGVIGAHLEAFLTGLDGRDVTGNTTTNDHEVMFTYAVEFRLVSRRFAMVQNFPRKGSPRGWLAGFGAPEAFPGEERKTPKPTTYQTRKRSHVSSVP